MEILTIDDVPRAFLESGRSFRAFQGFAVPFATPTAFPGHDVSSYMALLLSILSDLRDPL